MIIAIDGPAASGKSTIAKKVAQKLNYHYVSTGAMYRVVTLEADRKKVDIYNEGKITKLAQELNIEFSEPQENEKEKVFINKEEVTDKLYTAKVDSCVSYVAKVEGVRKTMVKLQRELSKQGDVVVEGRDIGTVVLPRADVKIFLTASASERAQRRKEELEKKGHNCDLNGLKREIISRDKIDMTRKVSPLVKACDAYLLDTTGKTIDEVVGAAMDIIKLVEKK